MLLLIFILYQHLSTIFNCFHISLISNLFVHFFDLLLYIGIHQYTQVYTCIQQYTQIYTSIHRYTQIYTSIHRYMQVYTGSPVNTGICRYTQVYTSTHQYTQVRIHQYTQVYTDIHQYVTPVYSTAQLNLTLARVPLAETRLIFKYTYELAASVRTCL